MKLKNSDIVKIYETLINIYNQKDMKFSAKIAFSLIRNINLLQPYYTNIMEVREDLIRNNGLELVDGTYQIPQDSIDFINQELQDLLDIECEIELNKINFEDFPQLQLTLNEWESLEKILSIED